jgi:hypothetical protein
MSYSRMSCLDQTVKLFSSTVILTDYVRPFTNKLFNSCYVQSFELFRSVKMTNTVETKFHDEVIKLLDDKKSTNNIIFHTYESTSNGSV